MTPYNRFIHKTIERLTLLTACAAMILSPLPLAAERFVTQDDGPVGPLSDKTIALWNSHGRYYHQPADRWQWQRPRLFGTVEDLFTTSYVLPFLIPMLENAGAYTMTPRERDTSPIEIILDGDGEHAVSDSYTEHSGHKRWKDAPLPGFAYREKTLTGNANPFKSGTARMVETVTNHKHHQSSAKWDTSFPAKGNYAVYVSYASLPASVSDARYKISAADGDHYFTVDQRKGGGTWIYLGTFPFEATDHKHTVVELTNRSAQKGVVTADAVKIGGGMGNVARKGTHADYNTSGYPRFTEAARYWLQWAGAPDSVYCASEGENDYTDDFKCRGLWVNWLMGGSARLPKQDGLGIPVDMSLGFHSDAGITEKDSIIGTLGIFCTERRGKFADGRRRILSRQLTDSVVSSIVRDICHNYRPDWSRRKMRDKPYAEARSPQVPAMLLELLSHQNPADLRLGLDPGFRFDVCRAVYKGILRYFAATEGLPYIVQPLPVRAFGITHGTSGNEYVLSWQPTVDSTEVTAMPTSYIVEERINDGPFRYLTTVPQPSLVTHVHDHDIHSYRITAVNKGGRSFPSEILALCAKGNRHECVTVVNGFTRVSGPEWFEGGNYAGFDYESDMGVPYLTDLAYTGPQFDFKRDSEFHTNDYPGFGGSRAQYETSMIAGNTFDFVYRHGRAIMQSGRPFISSSAEAFAADTLTIAPIVDLILGKQRQVCYPDSTTRFLTFPLPLQRKLTMLANHGCSMLISGAYVASDTWCNNSAPLPYHNFFTDVLGYKLRVPMASSTGKVREVPSPFKIFKGQEYTFNIHPDAWLYPVESPDAILPADHKQGFVIMRYSDTGNSAAIAVDKTTYRTIVMGFPLESILSDSHISTMMSQMLDFLSSRSQTTD